MAMVDDHVKDVSVSRGRQRSGDKDIKAFAAKTLPTLKAHLQQVQELARRSAAKNRRPSRRSWHRVGRPAVGRPNVVRRSPDD